MNPHPGLRPPLDRQVIQSLMTELASREPEGRGYEQKLQALGERIAHLGLPPLPREPEPVVATTGWRAAWQRQKASMKQSLEGALRLLHTEMAGPLRPERAPRRATARRHQRQTLAIGPARGLFTEGHLEGPIERSFMLYEPARREHGRAPLLVLLHGCHQGAIDFAAGTRMNEIAEDAGVMVLYPEQPACANALRCWNWYAERDASCSTGDADLIAAMTRQVMREHHIDASRVYVAGMSAGGAMAAVLARDHRRLYAALGVHSGVPAGLARDVYSALRLMAKGPGPLEEAVPATTDDDPREAVASIVFHGDEDAVVHPANGMAIHTAAGPAGDRSKFDGDALCDTTLPHAGQRGFTRSVERGPGGVSQRELWIVHGAGHAWAGGNRAQPHTDAQGPDASREMMRFFLQHRRAA